MDKVIFFDIDGTLLDTTHFAKTARTEAIKAMIENGLPVEADEGYEILMEIVNEKGSNYEKHFDLLTKKICGKENPLLVAFGTITYHNIKFSLLQPFSKTLPVLIYLKNKGYRLGVISNGRTHKQWEKLVRLNIHGFFEEVITSQEVDSEKPNKKIFEEALRRMDCEAKNSIMIGNKIDMDIIGAINSKIQPILVNSGLNDADKKEILEKFDIEIIDDIGELIDIL